MWATMPTALCELISECEMRRQPTYTNNEKRVASGQIIEDGKILGRILVNPCERSVFPTVIINSSKLPTSHTLCPNQRNSLTMFNDTAWPPTNSMNLILSYLP